MSKSRLSCLGLTSPSGTGSRRLFCSPPPHHHDDSHVEVMPPHPKFQGSPHHLGTLWRFPSNRPRCWGASPPAGQEGGSRASWWCQPILAPAPGPWGALSPTAPAAPCRGSSSMLLSVGCQPIPSLAPLGPPDRGSSPSPISMGIRGLSGQDLHLPARPPLLEGELRL